MGRDTGFSHLLHFLGANLNFDSLPVGADDGRVQGLVAVRLRHGDVVFEAPRYRLVGGVNDAQRFVTLGDVVDHDPESQNVVELIEVDVPSLHFFINGVEVLGPS